MPLGHTLVEHEIDGHPDLGVRVLPADLLHNDRVVAALARPLRKRRGTCAQEDDRRVNEARETQHLGWRFRPQKERPSKMARH